MAYATFTQLRQTVGDSRLVQGSPTSSAGEVQPYWEGKLAAASAIIDLHLDRAGHTTPVVVGDIPAAHQESAAAMLAEWACAIALKLGSPATIATPKGTRSAADEAINMLERIASGRLRIPWASKTEPAFGSVTSADIDSLGIGVPPLSGAHFAANRIPD